MYLNQRIVSGIALFQEAFFYLLDSRGGVIRSHGDFIDKGLLSGGDELQDFLPVEIVKEFQRFIASLHTSFSSDVVLCADDSTCIVRCSFKKLEGGQIELIGQVDNSNNADKLIPIDKLPLPIAVVKKNGEITQLNRSFIDYFLESRIISKPIFIQDIIKTNILSPEDFDYRKMIESDANSRGVFCHFKKINYNQTFLLNLIPINHKGEAVYLASVKDLTQFIEVQQNLEDQNEELRRQVQDEFEINSSYELKLLKKSRLESLGEIASGIFHELNQPLTHLSLKIDNMLEKWHRGEITEGYLLNKTEQIQRQISRMRGIIDEMKRFSVITESREEMINIKSVLNCALEDISYMQVNGLILVVNQVDDVSIKGTASELEQVFVNVLTNSIESLQQKQKAKPHLKPKLKVIIKRTKELLKVVFVDNGVGVSEYDMEHVFKPFYTTKKELGGTGLGLFIINNLMRKMNGSITVDSKEGKYFKTVLLFPVVND
jgi:signal transduction histidine kinase